MEQIILQGITAEELFKRLDNMIKDQMALFSKQLKNSNPNSSDQDLLSRKEVCQILKISLPTLNTWTKEGLIPSYRIGTRILYKSEDVNSALNKRKFTK